MKARKKTVTELADEWKNGDLDFHEALICHLVDNLGMKPDETLVLNLGMAISYCNMNLPDIGLEFPMGRRQTVAEVIRNLGLEAFLEKD